MFFAQIMVPSVTNKLQLAALITVCITQVILAIIGVWSATIQQKVLKKQDILGFKQDSLHHEMNSMKDALVAKTAIASHAEGMIAGREAERAREEAKKPQDGDERLREIRGNGPDESK